MCSKSIFFGHVNFAGDTDISSFQQIYKDYALPIFGGDYRECRILKMIGDRTVDNIQ